MKKQGAASAEAALILFSNTILLKLFYRDVYHKNFMTLIILVVERNMSNKYISIKLKLFISHYIHCFMN